MAKVQKLNVSGGLNDDHLKALGAVACNTTRLDDLVEALIWTLADFRSGFYTPGPIFTYRMSERKKKNVLISLAQHLRKVDPEYTKKAEAFASKIGRFQKRRNELIHASWNMTKHPENAYYIVKELTKHGPEWIDKTTNAKELIELANRAYRLSDECVKLITGAQSAHILRRRALRTKS